jgi:hypothetical protein
MIEMFLENYFIFDILFFYVLTRLFLLFYFFLFNINLTGVDTRDGETKPQLKHKLREVLTRLRPEGSVRSSFISDVLLNSGAKQENNKQSSSTTSTSIQQFNDQQRSVLYDVSFSFFFFFRLSYFIFLSYKYRNEPVSITQSKQPQVQTHSLQVKLVQCPSCLNSVIFDDQIFSHFKTCNSKLFDDFINYLANGGEKSDVCELFN